MVEKNVMGDEITERMWGRDRRENTKWLFYANSIGCAQVAREVLSKSGEEDKSGVSIKSVALDSLQNETEKSQCTLFVFLRGNPPCCSSSPLFLLCSMAYLTSWEGVDLPRQTKSWAKCFAIFRKRVYILKRRKLPREMARRKKKKEARGAKGSEGDKHMCLSARWIEFVSELQ